MSVKKQESVSCIAPNKVWSLYHNGRTVYNKLWHSAPIRGMDMCLQIFYVCVVSCSAPFRWIDLLASSPAK